MAEIMQAVRFHRFGGPEVLCCESIARPKPAEREVLARAHKCGQAGHTRGKLVLRIAK